MIPEVFHCKVLQCLPYDQRRARLRELESYLNGQLAGSADLGEWQARLYRLIDELNDCGYCLGPWDYDSKVEVWGGPSYMDPEKEDDLLLKSEYPIGVRLAWNDYEELADE